jgi:catechol 2,3-dioxygenase-like lactoylglutathione lyase family enzyme
MICGGFVRLFVADLDRAVRFYVETLGVKLVDESDARAVVDCGDGLLVELARAPGGEHRGGTAVGLLPKVPLSEAIQILENRGVHFDASHGFRDPDGNLLYLVEPRS